MTSAFLNIIASVFLLDWVKTLNIAINLLDECAIASKRKMVNEFFCDNPTLFGDSWTLMRCLGGVKREEERKRMIGHIKES